MSTADLQVDPGELQQISELLDGAGRDLFGRAPDLDQRPDAGASSGEVGTALASLASAVAGLAGHLGDLAAGVSAAGADFSATDQGVSGAFGGPRAAGP